MKYLSAIKDYIIIFLSCIFTVIFMNSFVGTQFSVSGESMNPTFHDKDVVYVNKLSDKINRLNRGDIVIFKADETRYFIKRLIGKPGDKVEYKNDVLYINDKQVKEEYLDYNKKHKQGKQLTQDFNVSMLPYSTGSYTIPDNKYLVLGDNRQNSLDSRSIGLIDSDKVVGEVVAKINTLFKPEVNLEGKDFNKVN